MKRAPDSPRCAERKLGSWAVAVGVVAGIVMGGITVAGAFDMPAAPAGPAKTEWPVNAKGLTYGSSMYALSPEDEPDLIEVLATNGKVGYALRTDLEGPTPATPEQAAVQQSTRDAAPRVVPVYDLDGVTEIGVFVIKAEAQSRR
ncbi:MAG: hypothetical protein U1E29_10555 [Coriobacteriia bacterium]|nr:hypothetical protein [Coriobacteriia bacterium]